jgi:hypothetical protein
VSGEDHGYRASRMRTQRVRDIPFKSLAPFQGAIEQLIDYQGWRAEAALTPGYFLSPLRGDCCASRSMTNDKWQMTNDR